MSAGRVVDAVPPAAGRAPFQADDLSEQARVVEKLDLACVECR